MPHSVPKKERGGQGTPELAEQPVRERDAQRDPHRVVLHAQRAAPAVHPHEPGQDVDVYGYEDGVLQRQAQQEQPVRSFHHGVDIRKQRGVVGQTTDAKSMTRFQLIQRIEMWRPIVVEAEELRNMNSMLTERVRALEQEVRDERAFNDNMLIQFASGGCPLPPRPPPSQ